MRGVWFELELANRLRQIRFNVPELRLQIERLESLDSVQTERMNFYAEAARERREALFLAEEQIVSGYNRESELRKELNAWERAPVLWLAIGAVAATAIYIATGANR